MLPKGILFDLDDTIISFDLVADAAWSQVCEKYYQNCGLSDSNDLFQSISKIRQWYWSDRERHKRGRNNLDKTRNEIVHLALKELGITNLDLTDKIANAYSTRRTELIHLFPRAKDTLKHLRNKKVSLALLTNGEAETQRAKINRFGLEQIFDVILIEGELGYGKPKQQVYYDALNALKLAPERVWAVGDNLEWDVWGPQQLGIYSIWNDYKDKGLPLSSKIVPNRIIKSIVELIE